MKNKPTMIAKDYLGNEIDVGDEVVFVQLGYRNFWRGIVKSITPKMLFITHKATNVCSTETKQAHDQVIVIKKG